MNEKLKQAKRRYDETPIPEELSFAVSSALRQGRRRHVRQRALRRGLVGLATCTACFALLVNVNPTFASAVEQVPVLGSLVRIFTVQEYHADDRDRLIDVRLPAVGDTGHTDLEQRINTEIQQKIATVLDEAEQRARITRDAYVSTGGKPETFIPILIEVDYEVTCQNSRYLSFTITKTETRAAAYTEHYIYNLDLETGRELSLRDILGPEWQTIANTAVTAGIAARSAEADNSYFEGESGFRTVAEDQKFYLNAAGNPVILFEKYEIAPGYMGAQSFEITP